MKKMKSVPILIIFFMIFYSSCQLNTLKDKKVSHDTIELSKILVIFYPSFDKPSLILCDIKNREILFQRIGAKNPVTPFSITDNNLKLVHAPYSLRYNISASNFKNLNDSIFKCMTKNDFIDKDSQVQDGIVNSLLFTFTSGNIKDVELNSCFTHNQKKLLKTLIFMTINAQTDSVSRNYLRKLAEYYE